MKNLSLDQYITKPKQKTEKPATYSFMKDTNTRSNMKVLKITLPKQLIEQLDAIKRDTGLTRSEHIRRGLGMYVDYVNKKQATKH